MKASFYEISANEKVKSNDIDFQGRIGDQISLEDIYTKDIEDYEDIQDAEIIQSSKNAICYLLKEVDLSASMRTLYDHYVRI